MSSSDILAMAFAPIVRPRAGVDLARTGPLPIVAQVA
jgi:hypothetical protein